MSKIKESLLFTDSGFYTEFEQMARQKYSTRKYKKSKNRGIVVSAATKAQYANLAWILNDYGIKSAYSWQKLKNKANRISREYKRNQPRRELIERAKIEFEEKISRSKKRKGLTVEEYVDTVTKAFDINQKIKRYNKRYKKNAWLLEESAIGYKNVFKRTIYDSLKEDIKISFEDLVIRHWTALELDLSNSLPRAWVREFIKFVSRKYDIDDIRQRLNATPYMSLMLRPSAQVDDIRYRYLNEIRAEAKNDPMLVLLQDIKNTGLINHALYVKGLDIINNRKDL